MIIKDNGSPLNPFVYEIASRLLVGVIDSHLRFEVVDDKPRFELILDSKVLATLDAVGYELHNSVIEPKRMGRWSNFLEGGSLDIANSLLRRLSFAGINCIYPETLSQITNPTIFQKKDDS